MATESAQRDVAKGVILNWWVVYAIDVQAAHTWLENQRQVGIKQHPP